MRSGSRISRCRTALENDFMELNRKLTKILKGTVSGAKLHGAPERRNKAVVSPKKTMPPGR